MFKPIYAHDIGTIGAARVLTSEWRTDVPVGSKFARIIEELEYGTIMDALAESPPVNRAIIIG